MMLSRSPTLTSNSVLPNDGKSRRETTKVSSEAGHISAYVGGESLVDGKGLPDGGRSGGFSKPVGLDLHLEGQIPIFFDLLLV